MSTVINSLPSADGFSMPGEFASHHGCLMIWPVRPGSWPFGGAGGPESICTGGGSHRRE